MMTQHNNDIIIINNNSFDRLLVSTAAETVNNATASTLLLTTEDEEYKNQLERMTLVNEILPRIDGLITVICSLCMIIMAWKRRDRLFHRLVLGMSIHLLIQGTFRIYGTAAVPEKFADVPIEGAMNASGNDATCTLQGFFDYFCINSAMLYYALGFATYSYVTILNNFDEKQYSWVEKYIHVIVHIYPSIVSVAVLSVDGFNNSGFGFCSIASSPLNCGEIGNSDVDCERGPETNEQLQVYQTLDILMDLFLLIFPTIIMMVLTWKVKQRQHKIHIRSRTVFIQSLIYLCPLYITVLPFLIEKIVEVVTDDGIQYHLMLAAITLFSLFGLFTLFMYVYFTIPPTDRRWCSVPPSYKNYFLCCNKNNNERNNSSSTTSSGKSANSSNNNNDDDGDNNNDTTKDDKLSLQRSESEARMNTMDLIFKSPNSEYDSKRTAPIGSNKTLATLAVSMTRLSEGRVVGTAAEAEEACRFSFNIFDGTNARGSFAKYVYEGDSEDIRLDNNETVRWNTVQNHV